MKIVKSLPVGSAPGRRAEDWGFHTTGVRDDYWFNPKVLGRGLRDSIFNAELLPGFIVEVIGYDVPSNPTIGLDRRNATKFVRQLGLNTPSTAQTLHIAAMARSNYEFWTILREHEGRNIVALTPIHPEDPTFFEFCRFEQHQSFLRREYSRSKGDRLYFCDHPINCLDSGARKRHYPLLIGIRDVEY